MSRTTWMRVTGRSHCAQATAIASVLRPLRHGGKNEDLGSPLMGPGGCASRQGCAGERVAALGRMISVRPGRADQRVRHADVPPLDFGVCEASHLHRRQVWSPHRPAPANRAAAQPKTTQLLPQ